jgi:hypothetical protein
METKAKQPREIVDYDINMEEYFEELDGDEVASVVLEVDNTTDPALELGPGDKGEYELVGDPRETVKIWTGGGKDGESYIVTAIITTVVGRREEIEFKIKVKET